MNRDPVADQELLTGSGAGIIFLGSGKGAVQGFFCLVDNKVLKKKICFGSGSSVTVYNIIPK